MKKERVRKFKKRQNRLAKDIQKAIGLAVDSVKYENCLTGVREDLNTGKFILEETSRIIIQGAPIRTSSKERVHVTIVFKGAIKESDLKVINSVLQTNYWRMGNSAVQYSVNPHNV